MFTTLDALDGEITTLRSSAENLQSSYMDETRSLERNNDLTPEAKQRQLEDLKTRTKNDLVALRDKETALLKEAQFHLKSLLFNNTTSSAVEKRDANDRVQRIEDATQAAEAYEQAKLQGDRGMCIALAQRAIDAGWKTVVQQHFNGSDGNKLHDLEKVNEAMSKGFARTLNYTIY